MYFRLFIFCEKS